MTHLPAARGAATGPGPAGPGPVTHAPAARRAVTGPGPAGPAPVTDATAARCAGGAGVSGG